MNNTRLNLLWLPLMAMPLLTACPGFGDDAPPGLFAEVPEVPTFEEHIQPLMELRCLECHAASPQQGAPGGFRLDVLEDGDGKVGLVTMAQLSLNRMRNPGDPMPPASKPQSDEIEQLTLEKWIACGAPRTAEDAECPEDEDNNTPPALTFDTVKPILDRYACTVPGACHGDANSSGLSLATFEELQQGLNPNAFVPCDADNSTLIQRMKLEANDPLLMPQGGPPMTPEDIATLEQWVNEGDDVTPLCDAGDDEANNEANNTPNNEANNAPNNEAPVCVDFESCRTQCDDPFSAECLIGCAQGEQACVQCVGLALDTCAASFCDEETAALRPCFQDCIFADDVLACLGNDCADELDAFDSCMEPIIRNRNCNDALLECDVRIPRE